MTNPEGTWDAAMEEAHRAILTRNVSNINEGMRLASVVVDSARTAEGRASEAPIQDLRAWIASLDDDAREQMTIGALTTLVQFRDRLLELDHGF